MKPANLFLMCCYCVQFFSLIYFFSKKTAKTDAALLKKWLFLFVGILGLKLFYKEYFYHSIFVIRKVEAIRMNVWRIRILNRLSGPSNTDLGMTNL